jgi:hypothetical protein
MRTETEFILKSRRVVPGCLLQGGFVFHYPDWNDAARDLVRTFRARPQPPVDCRVIPRQERSKRDWGVSPYTSSADEESL